MRLKNAKAFKPEAQVSYALFLENLISEFKPKSKEGFEKSIIEQIKDANIELTKECVRERKLKLMKDSVSPSDIATTVLNAAQAEAKTDDKSGDKSEQK